MFRGILRGIPGERIVPFLGTSWTYFPLIGTGDDLDRLHETYLRKYEKFGDVVAEHLGGKPFISVFNPKDIYNVFMNEGKRPERLSHEILLPIRRSKPELYATAGIMPSNGNEWRKLRDEYILPLTRREFLSNKIPATESVTREFIQFLLEVQRRSPTSRIDNLLPLLHEWGLETVCENVVGSRIDCFSYNRNQTSRRLITAAYDFLTALKESEYTVSWKYFRTKLYKRVEENELIFYKFISGYVEDAKKAISHELPKDTVNGGGGLLKEYLRNPANDVRDVISMTADFILAGLFTTAISVNTVLHHLAQNQDKQELLFQVIKSAFPDPEKPLDYITIVNQRYLNVCVKEALRLNPTSIGTGRTMPVDIVLRKRLIRKGTFIITQNHVTGRLARFVPDPLEFRPERHIYNPEISKVPFHPFIVLPFGQGARTCMGKLFAIQTMHVLIFLILRKYKILSHSPNEIPIKTMMVNIPQTPISIQLVLRDEFVGRCSGENKS